MTECSDCGEGPDITDHACWCETGHLALVREVKRLRAAFEASPAQGGDDFNPVFDAGFRQGRAFTQAETAVKQDSAPVCGRCDDTHQMTLHDEMRGDRTVMCTSCPTPCQKCRKNGNGPYCENTPCSCECHGTQNSAPVGEITKRVRAEQAVLTVLRANAHASGRAEMASEVRDAFNQCLSRLMPLEAETAIRHLAAKLPEAE